MTKFVKMPNRTAKCGLNALFSQLRTGGAWRFLPQEWPPWQTVYHYFRRWRLDGTWERIHRRLRDELRLRLGRNPQPSAGSIDSQSVKTTTVGGERGYDGAKRLVGRKRHVLVDTEGLLQALDVHAANIMDRDGTKLVLSEAVRAQLSRMRLLWLDAGYYGRGKGADLDEMAMTGAHRIAIDASRRNLHSSPPFDRFIDSHENWS